MSKRTFCLSNASCFAVHRASTVGFPGSIKWLPVIWTSYADGDGGLAELDGPVAEGFTMVSSNDGSGGFASTSTGGSSGASVNGEHGLVGSDVSTGGSSTGLATFAFLDLAWPLRKMLQDHQYKDAIWTTRKIWGFFITQGQSWRPEIVSVMSRQKSETPPERIK